MKLVIDASIAVKWIIDEEDHDLARGLLARFSDLFAPDFLLAEVGNVLWKKTRSGQLSGEQACKGLASMSSYFTELPPSAAFVERALALATSLDHPIYDCLYVACAESLAATFVTADEKFHRKALASSCNVEIVALKASASLQGSSLRG